ncbi:GlsB/YeaQ/YmgE family stress response membrane protein [Knoellia sp. Soil729]|uniref:GlsB/YeaQ/YmgE family stress response membrane protein n=1 Tax=Knoellia sp. Soil729 TaxID=1736394 RepID=UPI0006FA43E5|nr:GlsB/YeaQ/YmgE family stress response membrane protein [Knoellia sp. Soil729]KRE43553.1 transglycosylase [Knoellia sp. Soil729]
MIATLLGAVFAGLIIGASARLVLPGRQDISLLMTVVLGFLGSLVGSWLVYEFGYHNANGGFEVIPFLAGIVVAAVLILIYGRVTGRRLRTAEGRNARVP